MCACARVRVAEGTKCWGTSPSWGGGSVLHGAAFTEKGKRRRRQRWGGGGGTARAGGRPQGKSGRAGPRGTSPPAPQLSPVRHLYLRPQRSRFTRRLFSRKSLARRKGARGTEWKRAPRACVARLGSTTPRQDEGQSLGSSAQLLLGSVDSRGLEEQNKNHPCLPATGPGGRDLSAWPPPAPRPQAFPSGPRAALLLCLCLRAPSRANLDSQGAGPVALCCGGGHESSTAPPVVFPTVPCPPAVPCPPSLP